MLDNHQPHMLDVMRHFNSGSDYQRCSWSLLQLSCNHPNKIISLKLVEFSKILYNLIIKFFSERNKKLNPTSRQKLYLLSFKGNIKKVPQQPSPTLTFPFLVRHPTKRHLNKRTQLHVLFTWPSNYTVATSNLFPTLNLSSNWYIINAISLTAKFSPNFKPFSP